MVHEQIIRFAFFGGVLALVALWELFAPRRALTCGKGGRWFTNLALVLINTVLIRFLIPVLPVGMAYLARQWGWGLLNLLVLPGWFTAVAAVVALDFVIYLQHVLFHFIPLLWRLHRVHHTDPDIDVTTGNRFHPIEIIISIGIKLAAVCLIGPPPEAVVIFEVMLNACAQFNHGNIRIPETIDRWLRLVVVTPDMHRVHHSSLPRETNSNFGFNAPWWDRLCGTYRAQPELGHIAMDIGLKEYRDPAQLTLRRLLVQPFTG